MKNIKVIDDWLETAHLICTKTDGKTKYDFNKFMFPLKFTSKIYRHDLTLQKAKDNQQELRVLMNKLNNDYNPKKWNKNKRKNDTLKSAKKLSSIREEIINAVSEGIFLFIDGFQVEKELDEESSSENEEMDTTIMPKLESEGSAEQRKNQQGEG